MRQTKLISMRNDRDMRWLAEVAMYCHQNKIGGKYDQSYTDTLYIKMMRYPKTHDWNHHYQGFLFEILS